LGVSTERRAENMSVKGHLCARWNLAFIPVWLIFFSLLGQPRPEEGKIPLTTSSPAALKYFQKALRAWDESLEGDVVLNFTKAIDADAAFVMARAYYSWFLNGPESLKVVAEAKKYFDMVSEGERMFTLAMEARACSHEDKAISILAEINEKFPRDGRAHIAEATLLSQNGFLEKASVTLISTRRTTF
jgi:hypothetical protein